MTQEKDYVYDEVHPLQITDKLTDRIQTAYEISEKTKQNKLNA